MNTLDWEWCEFIDGPLEVQSPQGMLAGRKLVVVRCPDCRALVMAGSDQQVHLDWHGAEIERQVGE